MATERKTKTTIKKTSEPRRVGDSKSSKCAPCTRNRSSKTPDPGPMKKR